MFEKVKWPAGALLAPVPAVLVSCGDMEKSNVFTVAWTGIINTTAHKTLQCLPIPTSCIITIINIDLNDLS